jgi:arylsulfatase A-like enzyme
MDAIVARLMDELRAQGLLDNTIILFTADQGYHLGYRDLWCKHSLYPGTLHVPLLVRYPKAAASGARAAGIVELLDLFPTLTDLAGLPEATGMHGKSFARLLNDPKAEGKAAAFADDARGGHAVYTKDWAYIERRQVGEYELYNLRADPECFRNLADRPEHADVRRRHSEQVNRFFPEQAGKAKPGKRADRE